MSVPERASRIPRGIYIGLFLVIFLVSLLFRAPLVISSDHPQIEDVGMEKRNCSLYDPVNFSPHEVSYPSLKVKDPEYSIPWGTSRFRCFFKENEAALKVEVRKSWITYRFPHEDNSNKENQKYARVKGRSVVFPDVFPGTDVKYTVERDHVLEEIILYEPQEMADLVQEIAFDGVVPVEREGGIYFWNGEKFLFGIPPPVMYESGNRDMMCTGLHYELEVLNDTTYLRKVIDEEGLNWLMDTERVYPVVIGVTTQSFEDPWESSGLTPYGQYFGNLTEYISPATGSLTVAQTDFYLPGRGLDIAITRVYTAPAVFSTGCRKVCTEEDFIVLPNYEDAPYGPEYECPPVDVGNGWQLNFPWVGGDYIHFLDGTLYKKSGENHVGHHFTFADNVLTTASGVQYNFTGGALTTITDPDGNTITFNYSDGHLTTITDTVGRMITFQYNDKGQLIQVQYGDYAVTYAYSLEALASVTDPLGRMTLYQYDQKNNWLLTKVVYPTGGYTDYAYSYFSQEVEPPDPLNCTELRKYHITDQFVYSPDLVRWTTYAYQGDFDGVISTTQTVKNEQGFTKITNELNINTNGLITDCVTKTGTTHIRKVSYTYSSRKEVVEEDIYKGTIYAYTLKYVYDSWGNRIYEENGSKKAYYSYGNTDSENMFRDNEGGIQFSNKFFDHTIPLTIHTRLLGSVHIQDERIIEIYHAYNEKGQLVETWQVFQLPADYSVFSDVYSEGQTFSFDLTGVALEGDAVLKVTGLPNPNDVTKTETHSAYLYCTWLNEGYWQQNKFNAKYVERRPPYSTQYEPIGPFVHYPGTAGYQGFMTWVSVYTQYVKTVYTEPEDKYPQQVEYTINGAPWSVLTSDLEGNTVYYSVPVEELQAGLNTLEFRESSSWTTNFEWSLYVPHKVTPIEEVSTTYTYDAQGLITSIEDNLGNMTILTYDDQYNAYVTSITNALDCTVTASYDSFGLITSITDAQGNTTFFEYDILGRITKKINPDLSEKEAVYDDQNNKVTIYDELDNRAVQYFDGIGRLTRSEWYVSQTLFLSEYYTYTYMDRIKTVTDPGGHTTLYEYDVLGRPLKQITPDFNYVQIQYQDTVNSVTVFDENQHKKEYHSDWNGNLLWVKEYIDSQNYYLTQYTYNLGGNLTSLTDANGNTTNYQYDSLFGITEIEYPDSTTEQFVYDGVGNVVQRINGNGTSVFSYNSIYQLIKVEYPDQSVVQYDYDEKGNRIKMTDREGQTFYAYDDRNRLLSESRVIEGDSYIVTYTYDAASNVTSLTYPNLDVITYEYDSLNRLTSIPGYAQFWYNTGSLLASTVYGNGSTTIYQYDSNDRPVMIHSAREGIDLLVLNYQYDAGSNITGLDYDRRRGQEWVQSEEIFTYDGLNRLLSADGDYGSQVYSYDSVGNRLSVNEVTNTYNSMNELISASDGTHYTYDDMGNTLSKTDGNTAWLYTYDARNQLIQVEKNQEITAQYIYDGDGRRIKKTEWVDQLQEYQTIIYVYSGSQIIYEKNIDTNEEAIYVYGSTDKIAKKVNELIDYYHTDHLGSTRLVTSESGDTVTEVTYDPFGEDVLTGEKDSYLYTGKEKDSTGLFYYGARYYDPEINRFITRDPLSGRIQSPQTLNRYSYCLNNPLNHVDPQGLDCVFIILPDGTISYELADLYNRLLDALRTVNWDEIQSDLMNSDLMGALEGILREIFTDAKIESSSDLLTVTLQSGFVLGFFWGDSSHPKLGPSIWGRTDPPSPFGANIYLNKDLIHDAGDLFCVLTHELTHAYLSMEFFEKFAPMAEMDAQRFQESVAYVLERKIMSKISDTYLSAPFKAHVMKQFEWAWRYYRQGYVLVSPPVPIYSLE